MVSSSQQSDRIRKRKKTTNGKRNKRERRRLGTPPFPVHPDRWDLRFKRLIEHSLPHVVSILIIDTTKGIDTAECVADQGSGLLIRSKSTRFILTARHVAEGYRGKQGRAAFLGADGHAPHHITGWNVLDESAYLDVATIAVPRGFDERDFGKSSLWSDFPLARAEKGEPCVFFGFPGLHREVQPGGAQIALVAVSDFIVSVGDRHFVIADEHSEREVIEYTPGLKPLGPTGGVSGAGVFVRRGDALAVCGVVYEGGEGTDAWFYAGHADYLQADGKLNHARIPG